MNVPCTGTGFPESTASNVEVTAGGSPCAVEMTSLYRLSCFTTMAYPSKPPFSGVQGVQRLLWQTNSLTVDPIRALAVPAFEPVVSDVLPAFSLPLDANPNPFVQTLSAILTVPQDSLGMSLSSGK